MHRLNICRNVAFSMLAIISTAAWGSSFGVWTSADTRNNIGNASMPTAYGYSQGDSTVDISPVSPGTDITGFGTFSSGSYNYFSNSLPGTMIWGFTPTTYFVEAGAYFDGQAGNLRINGFYDEQHDTVTFELDQPTSYSVGASAPLQIDAEYPPVLTGPGGQTITITGAMSGTLAAGDWTLSMDIVGLTQSDWSAGVYDGGHVDEFLLTVPEPVGMGGIVFSALVLTIRRKSCSHA